MTNEEKILEGIKTLVVLQAMNLAMTIKETNTTEESKDNLLSEAEKVAESFFDKVS